MDAEVTIIGAGVIGLAIAEELSSEISGLFVIEKHLTFGQETSSRNNEVIHAGILSWLTCLLLLLFSQKIL